MMASTAILSAGSDGSVCIPPCSISRHLFDINTSRRRQPRLWTDAVSWKDVVAGPHGTYRALSSSYPQQAARGGLRLSSRAKNTEVSSSENVDMDLNAQDRKGVSSQSFEERLEAIKRSTEEKKMLEEKKLYGPIDYDAAPAKKDTNIFSLPVKVGIGLGVVAFGLIFAFGDILPSGVMETQDKAGSSVKEMSAEEVSKLKEQLDGFEAILKIHPDDLAALEGAAVIHAQLGDFSKSEAELSQLVEKRQGDPEALRLLGEVESALGKFGQSAASYRKALKASEKGSITLLKGLVEALVSQGMQNEAVRELIAARERLISNGVGVSPDKGQSANIDEINPVQIGLLLGKVYSEWGHVSDAVAVYENLIAEYPEDFRGYLAKAILLKGQGQTAEAGRMFIQARYFAPENLKPLVDRYSKI